MAKQMHFRSMALVIMVVLAGAGSVLAFNGSGQGTQTHPYVVTDVHQLHQMRNDPNASYVLGNDIDASETATWGKGKGFYPIGGNFKGTFDGRGFAIDKLFINRIDRNYLGLFAGLHGAVITNVHLTNAEVTGSRMVGVLAGTVSKGSSITHCSTTGTIKLKAGSEDSKSGGLIGCVGGGSVVTQCFSWVDIQADKRMQVGGLIGYLRGRGTTPITVLSNSCSYGTVTGSGHKQGNLLGDADGSIVDKCYSNGKGKALIGYNYSNPIITDCYWDKDKGAASSSRGGTGKTTADMSQQLTFVGWDFDEIWNIDEAESYPYFLD